MDNTAIKQRLEAAMKSGDLSTLGAMYEELAADDIVVEFPQSGEKFRGRDTVNEMNSQYGESTGTAPSMTLRRVVEPGNVWILESQIDYGNGTKVHAVSILEVGANGKIVRQTDYFADPFEAPEWRSKWTETGSKGKQAVPVG